MDFEYFDGDQRCIGVLEQPDPAVFSGKRPGVVVVHEAWGLGAQVQRRAKMLAQLGFVALAADIFGDRYIPKDPPDGMARIGIWLNDRPALRRRAAAAVTALQGHAMCDGRIAVIGYCFGGSTALEVARAGTAGVLGVVSFHGALPTPNPAGKGEVTAKILACHGAEDPLVPHAALVDFLDEMAKAGADCQTICYTGAAHSFTNPDADGSINPGIHYEEKADRRSWAAMQAHFAEVFGG